MSATRTAPSWLVDVPLAHRGLHGDGLPENSLPALEAARAAGYGVELDVWLTGDGVPVVVHDPVLTRLTGQPVRVTQAPLEQVQRLSLLGTEERIPTLSEAMDVLGTTPTMLEVKSHRPVAGPTEPAVVAVLDGHEAPWCVASLNPAVLRWFRRRQPSVPRVLASGLPATFAPLPRPLARRLAALRDLDAVAPVAVSYELAGLPNAVTDRWREGGGVLLAWTATSEPELARAKQVADNVIFEHIRPPR